jgi:hypothetical protein
MQGRRSTRRYCLRLLSFTDRPAARLGAHMCIDGQLGETPGTPPCQRYSNSTGSCSPRILISTETGTSPAVGLCRCMTHITMFGAVPTCQPSSSGACRSAATCAPPTGTAVAPSNGAGRHWAVRHSRRWAHAAGRRQSRKVPPRQLLGIRSATSA